MKRIPLKCLPTVLLFLLLAAAASCGQPEDSSPLTITDNSTQSALSTTAASASSDPTTAQTTAAASISPAPALPPEIVFNNPEDQTNAYAENLYVEANLSSVSVISGYNGPVPINGTIKNSNSYCNSLLYQINDVEYAMDGSALAILLDCNIYGAGRLVYSDGKTKAEIASDVDSFHLSGDGSAVLYLVTPKYEHGVGGDLYYYDSATGKSTCIAAGAGRLFTISPNGDSVSYTTFYKANDPDALTCYSLVIGKTPVEVDTDSYCAAISDDAKSLYYLKKTEDGEVLYVRYDGVAKQLSQPYTPLSYNAEEAFFFNIDQTQIVFNSAGATYFSMSGSDPYKLSDYPVMAFEGKSNFFEITDYLYKTIADSARSFVTVSVYGTKNLCYALFEYADNNVLYFDENMKVTVHTLPGASDNLMFSGHTVIAYESDGYAIYKNFPEPDSVKIPADVFPIITEDQTLYYVSSEDVSPSDSLNYTGNLYAVFGSLDTSQAELIASSASSLQLFEKDGPDILYYLAWPEGHDQEVERDYNLKPFLDLYAVEETPGAKPVLVAEDVCNIKTGDFGIVYWKYKDAFKGDYEPMGSSYMATVGVYASKDGKSFQYVMERPFVFQFGG